MNNLKHRHYVSGYIKILFFISVFISANNIFAQDAVSDSIFISKIEIKGNKKTKKEIILRELEFKEGDKTTPENLNEKIKQSKINLLKTPLFNHVEIKYEKTGDFNVKIIITTEERWYLWPQAAIYYADRNFSNWLKNKDLSRTDIGLGIEKYNFRGRNEKLKFYAIFGYDEELILKYENFYFDKKLKHSGAVFLRQLKRKETSYIIENDKVKQIKLTENYALKSYNVSIKYAYRNNIYNSHSFYLGFENREAADSLILYNPDYFTNDKNFANYFFLKYIFRIDKRDSRIFPLSGYNIKITALKNGLFVFNGSEINSFRIKTEFSKYTKLSEKIFHAFNLSLQKTAGKKNPFFLNTALGYSSAIRGHEYYAVNGEDFLLLKNTLNFEILPKKTIFLKFLPWNKINKPYINIFADVFADIAYVKNDDILYNERNELTNKILYGYGAGLNFLTYYDWLFRIDFSVNTKNEYGFFLHFEAPF